MAVIEHRSWDEFRNAGLIWWVNRILHVFGWAICVELDDDGKVIDVKPAHCKWRGFESDIELEEYEKLTRHMTAEIERIGAPYAD